MKDKACHPQGFWDIYKAINFNKGQSFECSWCEGKCKLKWKSQNKDLGARICSGFMWMSPAIALIALVASGHMSAIHAIILITIFHFAAMYFLINSGRLTVQSVAPKKSPKKAVKKKNAKKKK